jgi:hypothetical protein
MSIGSLPGRGIHHVIPWQMIASLDPTLGRNVMNDPKLRRVAGLVAGIAGGSAPLAGYHTESDIIRTTIDTVDTNTLWREFQAALNLLNKQRQPLVDLMTYSVPNPIESVPQVGNGIKFEKSSEFGVPRGIRTGVTYFQMGFGFDDYDIGVRYTWRYLRDATAEQVRSDHDAILEADNRLMFEEVMRTLYRSTNRTADINGNPYNVYAFYNNDGTTPPTYKTTTHTSSHSHYIVSGGATVDTGDLELIIEHLDHHGYSTANGYTQLICVNKAEGDVIRQFRSIANGGAGKYDFIPARGTPNFLLPTTLRVNSDASAPQNTYRGISVIGSYGDALVLQDDYFAAGWIPAFATGGPESVQNPIGIREHARADMRGLRLLKGRDPDYPLQESYYGRSFGTGVRHRGAGLVMKIAASGAYSVPTMYA